MTLLNDTKAAQKQAITALAETGAVQPKQAQITPMPSQEQDSGGQVLEFTGLDLTEKAGSGSFLECSNVSTRNYPCLSPRIGRSYSSEAAYQGVGDIFRFDGKTVYRKGTQLWYDPDGDSAACIGTVTNTRKSFAVVNSRLVIFPDAVSLDLRTGKLSPLALDITVTGASVSDNKTITGTFPGGGTVTSQPLSSYSAVELIIPYYDTEADAKGRENGKRFYTLHNGQAISSYTELVNKYIVPAYGDAGYSEIYGYLNSHRTEYSGDENGNGVYGKITSVTRTEENGFYFYTIAATLYNADGSLVTQTFRAGDVIEISGLVRTSGGAAVDAFYSRVWEVTGNSITFSLNSLTGMSVGADGKIGLNRKVPQLDYICSADNRIWGVSNSVENESVADDGSVTKHNGRAIYCSKLGDPANWYYYQGVSMDSWTAAVSSEGDFTGICEWSGDVLCFKEREMFRVTGSVPSAYTLYQFSVPGVEAGSGGSIAVIDEVVYYKSEHGVYRYSGGTPTRVSENVADTLSGPGNAGTDGRNYFLSVGGSDNPNRGIYVYDTWNNAWSKHDSAVGRFASDGGVALFLRTNDSTDTKEEDKNTISRMDGGSADGMPWSVTMHPDYGTTKTSYYSTALNMGYKYFKFVFLRGELLKHSDNAVDPFVKVWAKMGDGDTTENGGFLLLGTQTGAGKFVLRMPVKRAREDRIQLRLTGKGDCVLRDVRYVYSTGSEWVQSDKGAM